MQGADAPHSPADRPQSRAGNPVVFWLLALMALSVLIPCILLPEWRHYEALRIAEQAEAHRLKMLNERLDRESRRLEAMSSDPAAISRAVRRTLNYSNPGDRLVHVDVEPAAIGGPAPFVPQPVTPPPLVAGFVDRLPRWDYDALFCDPQTRLILMVMSIALLVVACALFRRRPEPVGE